VSKTVDKAIIGYKQVVTVTLERGRLRMFADAIGETDPVYRDFDAARAAGHPDIPALPTVLGGLEMEGSDTVDVLARHGVNLDDVLHGEQSFTYHFPVHAGDQLTFRSEFTDVYSKSGGRLTFIVRRTDVVRGDGVLVAEIAFTTIVRQTASSRA
jgi:acyl dehydratase